MKRTAESQVSSPYRVVALGMALMLAAAGIALAQPQPPGNSPGNSDDTVAFEVQSIDQQSWIVTARDLESGEEFSFRLPPEAFRGQRFQADLGDAAAGRKVTVAGETNARLHQASVERPLGREMRSESGFRMREPGSRESGADRYAVPGGPSKYDARAEPHSPSKYSDRPGPLSRRGASSTGPSGYEVVEVDSITWTVTARADDGETVSLEIDPMAFVGYRFRASVKDLRAGEGFELLADNESPLGDCCTLKDRPRR